MVVNMCSLKRNLVNVKNVMSINCMWRWVSLLSCHVWGLLWFCIFSKTVRNDWALQELLSSTLNSLCIVVNANVHCINVFNRYTYVLFQCYKLMTWVYMQQRGHLVKITNALIKMTMYETSYRWICLKAADCPAVYLAGTN